MMSDVETTASGPAPTPSFSQILTRGALPRLLLLGLLVLLLTIPLTMVRWVLSDRTGRQWEVESLIAEQWGAAQTIAGPVVRVPYIEVTTTTRNNETVQQERRHMLEFLPETLTVDAQLAIEERAKGPYVIPVYGAELAINARLAQPDFAALGIEPDRILWNEAVISMAIADPSALRGATLRIGDTALEIEPGFAPGVSDVGGFHARLKPAFSSGFGTGRDLTLSLSFNGMSAISILPLGEQTTVHIAGNWPHPNFAGSFLPVERTVTDIDFDARWEIASLARSLPNSRIDGSIVSDAMLNYAGDRFGVELTNPVDVYAQVDRVLKYGILVIGLTFAAIFVIGVLRDLRAHTMQYLLVGGSLALFYLMLLALAEHMPFLYAYLIAAALDLAAVSLYVGRTVSRAAGIIVALLLAVVRGFMYLLLQEEDLSLLIGSVGLFVALAVVMYATRNVDWYRIGTARTSGGRSAAGAPAHA
jgi:inner membrane protein